MAMVSTVKFTDPMVDSLIRPDRRVSYYLTHRPTHPFILAPMLLIIGGIVVLVRRGRGKNPTTTLMTRSKFSGEG